MEYKDIETLSKAEAEVKRVIDLLKANEDALTYINLKLHDASYYCYSKMEDDFPLCYANNNEYHYFYQFCDISYDEFIEWCNEEGIDFNKMKKPLGRTSSFYLQNFYAERDIDQTLYNLLNNVANWWYGDYINFNNGELVINDDDYENYEECVEEVVEYLATNFYKDVEEYLTDILKVYNYIKDFKDNQVECFKEFLEYEEEVLQYEKEEEEKKALANRKECYDIKDGYGISEEHMNRLKQIIFYYD